MKRSGIIICLLAAATLAGMAQEVSVKEKSKNEKVESEEIVVRGQPRKVEIKVKDGEEGLPVIIIDGKEYDYELLELIDPDKIESITVLKGKEAIDAYGAENGVIKIKTKKEAYGEQIEVVGYGAPKKQIVIEGRSAFKIDSAEADVQPLILIDGEVSDKDDLDNLSPEDIESIQVLKNEEAIKRYNSETGVILIETKKN